VRSEFYAALLAVVTQAPSAPSTTPARDVAVRAEINTSTVRGRITSADSGSPLRRAQITLQPLFTAEHFTATSGSDGGYEIRDVVPGRYKVTVKRNGYLPRAYGQRRPGDVERYVDVEPRATVAGLDFALNRASVISGRVTDDLGEPITGAWVFAMLPESHFGRPQLATGSQLPGRTDDDGRYRILSLAPAEYIVMAMTDETWTADDGSGRQLTYSASYYPGTNRLAGAHRVHVPASREVGAIDLSLVPRRTASVRGVAIDARGAPIVNQPVSLMRALYRGMSAYGVASGVSRTAEDGSWSFPDVRPGEYRLFVKASVSGRSPDQADQPILVDGADLTGIVLTAGPGGTVRGRVVTEDGRPLPAAVVGSSIRVRSAGVDPPRLASLAGEANGRIARDGAFEFSGTFGPTFLSLGPPSKAWAVRAIYLGDRDITGLPIDLAHGAVADAVRIVVTTKPSVVSGGLKDADGKPADGTLLVFPDDPSRWIEGSPLIRLERSDSDGRFRIEGLPPGSYRCVGFDFLDRSTWLDPSALETLSRTAMRVRVDGVTEGLSVIVRR
jgi:Carboxypeptidase regulatory-like domain